MTSLGFCPDDRDFLSSKRDIDESKGSKRRVWMKNLLDELHDYISDNPPILRYIETQEVLAKTLNKPPSGVTSRWGYYGMTASWFAFATGRVELIVRYALSEEPRLEVEEEPDGFDADAHSPARQIERIKKDGVRAMLRELADPEKRIGLIIFEWWYETSLGKFLDFTQSKRPYQARRRRPCRRSSDTPHAEIAPRSRRDRAEIARHTAPPLSRWRGSIALFAAESGS